MVGILVTAYCNQDIEKNGNYTDPLYGKIEFTNLLTAHAYAGDVVPFEPERDGKPMQLNLTREHRDTKNHLSTPYNLDEPPRYYVRGGMIFQELSRQYLKEWGPNWQREAPQRLVYMDHFQSELFPDRNRRVVILSQVLPANSTIGYDDLAYLTVKKVNGKEIKSLDDLAEAVKQPVAGFIKIETEEDPKQIELRICPNSGVWSASMSMESRIRMVACMTAPSARFCSKINSPSNAATMNSIKRDAPWANRYGVMAWNPSGIDFVGISCVELIL